jgi:hypothetical protein
MDGIRGGSARLRTNTTRNRLRYGALALAVGTSAAGGIMILAAGNATAVAAPHKVFVCKYVGTPGADERLQTGQNPIDVDVHALPKGVTPVVGTFFNDAQGRSFVLAFDTGQPEPDVSQCPNTTPSTPLTPVTPAAPTPSTPDCTTQTETVTLPSQAGVVWTPSGNSTLSAGQSVTYTASAAAGYTIPAGAQVSWTFTNTFNNAQCLSTGGSSSVVSSPASSTAESSPVTESTSPSLGVSGSEVSNLPGSTTAAAPIPAGVSAGLHTPIANAGLRAWGTVLLLMGGIGGLMAGLWPTTRRRVH